MKVSIKKETMVPPAEETPQVALWASNVDLIIPQIHTSSVYFYRPSGSPDFFSGDVLRDALAKALVPFYPMAGRLARDQDGRIQINCNAAGVLLVEAEADVSIDDLGGFAPHPVLQQLVPTVVYTKDITAFPLLVLQVTRFKCGGASLGVGMEHHIADGTSGIHFINTWSDVARGEGVKVLPFVDRTLLRARSPPTPQFEHVEYQTPFTLQPRFRPEEGSEKVETVVESFTFSREQLGKLKAMVADPGANLAYSSYVALSAHIWRCATRARGLSGDQPSKLFVATDGRARLRPPLPRGYFGNVIFTCTPVAEAEELVAKPLIRTAARIQEAVLKMGDEYLRSALDYLELLPDMSVCIRGAAHFGNPNLCITSWSGLPVYDCDFGWGRAIHMGPCQIGFEGLCFVLGSATKDGSLGLALRLRADHMADFRKLVNDI
uniref:Hydroxycinnamoyltransferase n=1 Tax=Anthoceros agrestis TaxID=41834 RepID=A0A8K1E0Z7_9EMBR|nr:hydroxycinnamoyltransferase [Anthoceros agrestis]